MGKPAKATPAWEYASDVQVGFVGADGAARLGPLARYWAEPFELTSPTRKFIAFKGQKNFTGDYWAATSRDLVGYESWVERDAAMALDFDPAVVALASQPFHLVWADGERDREHTPDYFARLSDGTGVVVYVRPESLVGEEAAEVFAFTARVCTTVGWQFRLVGDLDQPFRANLRWLARYRHPRCHQASVAEVLQRCSPNHRCCSRGPGSSPGSTGPGSSSATPTSAPRPSVSWTCTPAPSRASRSATDEYVISSRREDLHPGPLPLPPDPGPGPGPRDARQPRVRPRRRPGLPGRLRRPPGQGLRPLRAHDRHRPVHEPGRPRS